MTESKLNGRVWLAAAAALVLSGGGGGYWLSQHLMKHDAAVDPAVAERKVLYWHDPMVPGVRFDKPGKSPYMDMQLVPVYADEARSSEDSGVRVSANVAQNLGIRLGKVEKATLQTALSAVGSVEFDEHLLEVVPARVEGYVTRLFVRAPLERVHRGQPLAEIQAPAWLEAQQEYLALLDAKSEAGQSLRGAARERMIVLGVPEATIRRIESQRRTSATTTIVAPIDGVLSELGVREGTAFMPGTPLFRVNGLTRVWANARIPEAQVSMVPMGVTATARATAWPGVDFKGRVIALLPQIDAETRTLTARVALDNADGKLSPGMFVTLEFASAAGEAQLVVPSEAVITTGERSVVIVVNADGSFAVTGVTPGVEQAGRTAILAGLTEGQSIVVSGQFLIDSEASLQSTVSRLESAAPEHAP
jgi:Cu(I)/Ag(I) efflux system membrane fusion protein